MILHRISKVFAFVVVFMLLSVVQAEEFKVYKNYDKALKKAKSSSKNLMMMLHSPHCPWCERMKEETLSQKETQDFIQKGYVFVSLNKYRDDYPKKFQSNMIPTIFLIDSKNENENYKMLGFQTVESFIDEVSLSEGL